MPYSNTQKNTVTVHTELDEVPTDRLLKQYSLLYIIIMGSMNEIILYLHLNRNTFLTFFIMTTPLLFLY